MTYPGGKAADGVYHRIINQIPPHRTYIEPFMGGAAILRMKRPSAVSIAVDMDPEVVSAFMAERPVPGALAVNDDAISFLERYPFDGSEYVYADPPYLRSVRSSKDPIYKFEFWEDTQHLRLLEVLRSLPCPVAISGYWSELYAQALPDWRSIHYQVGTRGGFAATEYLWMNYPEPTELHDYRYLGENFREREKINKVKRRWAARLKRMDPLQRYAVLSAIEDLRAPTESMRGEG